MIRVRAACLENGNDSDLDAPPAYLGTYLSDRRVRTDRERAVPCQCLYPAGWRGVARRGAAWRGAGWAGR